MRKAGPRGPAFRCSGRRAACIHGTIDAPGHASVPFAHYPKPGSCHTGNLTRIMHTSQLR